MALHKRAASQYHWFHLLSAVVCLTSFASANEDPLRTAIGDNEVKHQWNTNDTGTEEGADFEDRGHLPVSAASLATQVAHKGGGFDEVEKAIFEGETALTKPKIEQVQPKPTIYTKNYDDLVTKLGAKQVETAWNMIKNRHKLLEEDGQLQGEYNLLKDINFIRNWNKFSHKTWIRESPPQMLYNVLKIKLRLPQLLELTMKGLKYSEKLKGPQDPAIIKMQTNALVYAVPEMFRGFLRDEFVKSLDVKDLFISLQLNKDPGPLANPFLSILAHSRPRDDLFPLISSYYADDSILAQAMTNAKDTQEKHFLLEWQKNLDEKLEKKRKRKRKRSDIRELL